MTAARTKRSDVKPESLKATWAEICHQQRGLMVAMVLMLIASIVLFIVSMTVLRPQNTVVIVGYGDVYGEVAGISGGYRRESWLNMLAFPLLAVLYGVIHNLLIIRVFRKYGRDTAMVVVAMTMLMILMTFVILFRLVGEW